MVALAGIILDAAADLAADGVERQVPLEDPIIQASLGREHEERQLIHLGGVLIDAPEGLGDAGDAPRRLVVVRRIPHPGRQPGEQLRFDDDELTRPGRQRQGGGAGITDGEMTENGVGVRPGLGQAVAPKPGQESRRQPGLREPARAGPRREGVAVSAVAGEPVEDDPQQPVLVIELGRWKGRRPGLAGLQHRLDSLDNHRPDPGLAAARLSQVLPALVHSGSFYNVADRAKRCTNVTTCTHGPSGDLSLHATGPGPCMADSCHQGSDKPAWSNVAGKGARFP